MALRVAVQMDPLESINMDGDSTFALMLEAQARGHALWHYQVRHLSLHAGRVIARAHPVTVRREPAPVLERPVPPTEFVVVMAAPLPEDVPLRFVARDVRALVGFPRTSDRPITRRFDVVDS